MEEEFSFLEIVPFIVIGLVMLMRFFAKAPQVEPNTEPEEVEYKYDESLKTELQQEQYRVVPRGAKTAQAAKVSAEAASSEIEAEPNHEATNEVEFDLRQAVIMSEILTRKYDE